MVRPDVVRRPFYHRQSLCTQKRLSVVLLSNIRPELPSKPSRGNSTCLEKFDDVVSPPASGRIQGMVDIDVACGNDDRCKTRYILNERFQFFASGKKVKHSTSHPSSLPKGVASNLRKG